MNKYNPTPEQKNFIENTNRFLIVSAGPGSGKTATIVEYLKNITNVPRKQIIISSFTKNSTNEIKNRFIRKYPDPNESFSFQTFDSFLITKIWKFYFNRILKFAIQKFDSASTSKFGYEQKQIVYSKISWQEFKANHTDKNWIIPKVKEFVNYGKEGKLLVGFVTEYILLNFIKSNENIGKYLSANIKKIIIDEAQDLSKLRYMILIYFYEIYKIEVVLVGDERQTIYEYLGAEKNIFESLQRNKKYIEQIYLTQNFRYTIPHNLDSSMLGLIQSRDEISFRKKLKLLIEKNDIETITYNQIIEKIGISKDNLFLTKTNAVVEKISKNLMNHKIKNRAVLGIPKKYNISHEEQSFIENIYIYNQIKIRKIKYSLNYSELVNEICDFIWPFNPNKNENFLKLFWNDKFEFDDQINEIIKLTKIKNFKEIIDLFSKSDNYLRNIRPHKNQVMTYHRAKGLEGDNIFIDETNVLLFLNGDNNAPTFNEMYVAISRVKNKIYLIKNETNLKY